MSDVAIKDLSFNLIGRDISASKSFEALGAKIKGLQAETEKAAAAASAAADRQAAAYARAAQAAESAATKETAAQKAARLESEKTAAAATAASKQRIATVTKVGKGFALAGLVIAGVSADMAMHFQASMTLLQTAAGESAKNMKTVSNGILDLARQTGTSTQQLADGMYIVEKAGNRGAAGLQVLKAAAQGAKAENVDLSTATTALTSVMQSYGLKAKDAVSTENELVRGSGLAKTTMQEYADSLSTVIPIASAAHIGFSQVAGAIATLTQHGTTAREATQELSNTIRNLLAPNQVAQKAMQQLGLSVNGLSKDLSDPSVGLQGTIDKIVNTIGSHLGPAGDVVVDTFKKSASATQDLNTMVSKMPANLQKATKGFLDGSVSFTDYRKTIRGAGADGYALGKQLITLATNVDGFNDLVKSGQPQALTFANYLKKIMGGATGLNTALMLTGNSTSTFASDTKQVADAGKHAGQNISTWAQTQATLKVKLDQAKESLATMAIQIGTLLLPALGHVADAVSKVVGWLEKHKTVAKALAIVIGGALVVAIGSAIAAWLALNLAFIATPIGALITAFVAVVAGLVYLSTKWNQIWGWIKNNPALAALAAISFPIVAAFVAVAGALHLLFTHWSQIWGAIKGAFVAAWNGMMGAMHKIEAGFFIGVKAIDDVFLSMVSTIIHGAADAFGWVPGLGGKLKGAAKAFDDFKGKVDGDLQAMINRAEGKPITPKVNTEPAMQSLDTIQGTLNAIHGKTVAVNVQAFGIDTIQGQLNALHAAIAARPHASGGYLSEGWNTAGEGSATELMYKQGSRVKVYTHPQSLALMGAAGGTTVVNVSVAGSVISEKNLTRTIASNIDTLRRRNGRPSILNA